MYKQYKASKPNMEKKTETRLIFYVNGNKASYIFMYMYISLIDIY